MAEIVNLKQLFAGLQALLVGDLELARAVISHSGDKGGVAEANWGGMLAKHLAGRYCVDKATVIAAHPSAWEAVRMRRRPLIDPVPPGTYRAKCRELNPAHAAANGHGEVYPAKRCVSDGQWCAFYRGATEVWGCNATYAAANFIIEPLTSEAKA